MSSHPELEQLSAYLDAELEAPEHTALEAHLPSCAECRSILDALRATIADLGELPEAAPTEQDSWALRSAISRARAPVKRWQRVAWAAGAVAAAAIAVVAIVQPGNGGRTDLASGGARGALPEAGASAVINYGAGTFDAGSAQAKLLVISGKVAEDQVQKDAVANTLSAPAATASRNAVGGSNQYSFATKPADVSKEIDRCVAQIKRSTQKYMRPVEYDVGTYESTPAFLLFFQVEDRYELWVVDRTPQCTPLYFAQAA